MRTLLGIVSGLASALLIVVAVDAADASFYPLPTLDSADGAARSAERG